MRGFGSQSSASGFILVQVRAPFWLRRASALPPASCDLVPERLQCMTIGRHRVVVEVAADDLPQPFALFGNRLVHAPPQRLLDLRSFARMRSVRVFRLMQEFAPADLPLMKVKPRKLKVSGLPSPRCLRLSAAWRPNSISRVFSG